jgi:hypothetical protein
MSSTLDELEEIERAAKGRMSPPPPVAPKGERRRGSSMFLPPSAKAATPTLDVASTPKETKGEMLEDFPSAKESEPKQKDISSPVTSIRDATQPAPVKPPDNVPRPMAPAVKRGSVALKPMSGIGGLVDFDDSDFDDSDDDMDVDLPGAPMPGSGDAVGGPNHRPLVGGFAAAAYEAARAHHYQSISKPKPGEVPKNRGPMPSI